ncbi:predicted protein [Methanosarcina acetivorans C2A]|uniref:Uncharacterized protein n=1 Tax=Methanosarcina acetivorans (strain ATCC 35395 / DSM 2834 / JCM 12185 / C2A) TaxID=188937 RepID=Q8TTQ5_METAC|nr:predicted protein [Methanosarcina acetivorans C2A]
MTIRIFKCIDDIFYSKFSTFFPFSMQCRVSEVFPFHTFSMFMTEIYTSLLDFDLLFYPDFYFLAVVTVLIHNYLHGLF